MVAGWLCDPLFSTEGILSLLSFLPLTRMAGYICSCCFTLQTNHTCLRRAFVVLRVNILKCYFICVALLRCLLFVPVQRRTCGSAANLMLSFCAVGVVGRSSFFLFAPGVRDRDLVCLFVFVRCSWSYTLRTKPIRCSCTADTEAVLCPIWFLTGRIVFLTTRNDGCSLVDSSTGLGLEVILLVSFCTVCLCECVFLVVKI